MTETKNVLLLLSVCTPRHQVLLNIDIVVAVVVVVVESVYLSPTVHKHVCALAGFPGTFNAWMKSYRLWTATKLNVARGFSSFLFFVFSSTAATELLHYNTHKHVFPQQLTVQLPACRWCEEDRNSRTERSHRTMKCNPSYGSNMAADARIRLCEQLKIKIGN